MRDKDKQRAYNRAYYLAHREEILARVTARREDPAHRKAKAAYTAEYRIKHPEKVAAAKARWFQENKERAYAVRQAHPRYAEHSKNARRKRRDGLKPPEWMGLVEHFAGRCAYCRGYFGDRLEPDHVIPLSKKGGAEIGNILPACRSCNARKQGRTLAQWRPEWAQYCPSTW